MTNPLPDSTFSWTAWIEIACGRDSDFFHEEAAIQLKFISVSFAQSVIPLSKNSYINTTLVKTRLKLDHLTRANAHHLMLFSAN